MNDHSSTGPTAADLANDALFGAAILKLSFIRREMINTPGFTFVYNGTLRELGVTDSQVDRYIKKHREALVAHIEQSERTS